MWAMSVFGILFLLVAGCAVVMPWLKGRSDLMTSWNFFLIGSMNYFGYACITNTRGLPDTYFDDGEVPFFIAGGLLFYGITALTYYRMQWPGRMAEKWLNHWPAEHGPRIVIYAVALFLITILLFGFGRLPFINEIARITIAPISVGVLGLIFYYFLKNPVNPLIWPVLILAFIVAYMMCTLSGIGRRDLLGLLLVFPIVLYWVVLRNRSRFWSAIGLTVVGIAVVIFLNAFTSIRHDAKNENLTGFQLAEYRLRAMPAALINAATGKKSLTGGDELIGGQNAVWCSLLTIELVKTDKSLEVSPLHSMYYVVAHPIPSRVWPNKPRGFGDSLPRFVGKEGVNWGPGIVGHGFYDGGFIVLALYGLLHGVAFSFIDRKMKLDPGNPFLMAILGGIAGQIIALPRGDIGLFTVLILAGAISQLICYRLFRHFGGQRTPAA